MPVTTEVKNGAAIPGELITFEIDSKATVVVSNQSNDAQPFDLELLLLRRKSTSSDTDYAKLEPEVSFDNGNNYEILVGGFYALRVVTATNIIVTVTE